MTKQDILEATLELASEKGLGRVSMQMIANQVGLKKSSLYSHFKSKDEIIESMYIYFREQAKNQTGNESINLEELLEEHSLYEILTLVVDSYRKMNSDPKMNRFYSMIYSEKAYDPNASQIIVEETNRMIKATQDLFTVIQAHKIADFDSIEGAALLFAMGVHSILDFEIDASHIDSKDANGKMDLFIQEFCKKYGGKEL